MSEGPACSKHHPRTRGRALRWCCCTPVCAFCLSGFTALLQAGFQGQLPPVRYFQPRSGSRWTSQPLTLSLPPQAPLPPNPPKARAMPDSTPTACLPTLSTSQPPQRPPALRGFLDPPPPSGSQPPGGTKSSLTWTGRWPSRLEPTVTAQPSIPCQAAPECVYMIRIKEKEQAREREKA